MRDYEEFSKFGYDEMQIEVLQEISNIGVGHAATALSQLLHRRVDMSIPYVELIQFGDLSNRLVGSPEAVTSSILIETTNYDDRDKTLSFLCLFNDHSSKNILSILKSGSPPDDLSNLDEISFSILEETGNILLLHTISAINSFSGTKWFPSSPQCSIDMIGAIVDGLLSRLNNEHNIFLLVECDVFTDEDVLKGQILIIPNNEALKLIMTKLYGEDFIGMMG